MAKEIITKQGHNGKKTLTSLRHLDMILKYQIQIPISQTSSR